MLSISSYPALHVRYNYFPTKALTHWSVGGFLGWLEPSCLLHIVNLYNKATSLVLRPQIGYIIEIPWRNQATSLMHPCNWFGAEGWPL